MENKIRHQQKETKGIFFIQDGMKMAAHMTYSKAGPDKIIIDHTVVEEAYKGHGLGSQLVKAAVVHARENELKILPLCPFANAEFKKHPEYDDVKA
ncbi:GNAT family N-acetyltransferase [Ascidiimonas aurantiaca]|uniref:GNAT family N-acetyltransferase n=1 Tax=Ascidiimonas aurantiaca TaxID=1685432 RepID=UPI0030ECCEFD